jgi:metallo-beta-lactamase class B
MSSSHSRRLLAILAVVAALHIPAVSAAAYEPAWTQAQQPFHIVGDIYYVGSKGLAAYLITSPQGHILIDGTVAENAPMIEANIKALGFRLQDVKILLANHAHHDHAGALAQLKQDTGGELLASPGDRWALEHGRARGDNTANLPSWPPVKVDRLLHDGEVIHLGSIALSTVYTPGHTPGCTSWTTEVTYGGVKNHVLFLCSLTVAGNVLVGNKAYPTIVADYRRSFERLEAYNDADLVLTGHPEVTDVLGRHEAQLLGDPDPWGDSGQLGALLDVASAELDKALGKPQESNTPVESPISLEGWRNVVHADDRFAVQFPKAPMMVPGRYDLGGRTSVPGKTYAAERAGVVYRLTVANVSGKPVDREAVFRDAIGRLSEGGRLRTYAEARIRTAHGRQVSVEQADGGRTIASVFITPDRLYELQATAPGPDGRAATAAMIRFQQTLNLF